MPVPDGEVDAVHAPEDGCAVVPVAGFVVRQARRYRFQGMYTKCESDKEQGDQCRPPTFAIYFHRRNVTA